MRECQMRNRRLGSIVLPFGAMLCSLIAFAQRGQPSAPSKAQAAAPAPAHDLTGIWMFKERMGGVVHGTFGPQVPPMTPWAQARFDSAKSGYGDNAAPGGNDPITTCDPNGLTRVLIQPTPIEIIQIPGRVVMNFEWSHIWRYIWTDGRELPKDSDPSWYGYSVGKWAGDTFVVETIGFNDKPWVDFFGHPRSEDMRLTERYQRVDRDTLELVMTIDDPKAYTKPWVSNKKTYKLAPKEELRESICAPSEEEAFGKRMREPAAGQTGK